MSVIQFPTGHVHIAEPMSEERESIAAYLEWAASVDVGTVLSDDERQGILYAAAWVRNRLDRRPR